MKNILVSVHLLISKKENPTKDRIEFVLIVKEILTSVRWKQIISHLGIVEEKPQQKIARCYVKTAIEQNRANNLPFNKKEQIIDLPSSFSYGLPRFVVLHSQ